MFDAPSLLILSGGLAVCLIAAVWWYLSRRVSVEELERRRRLMINAKNRVIEGLVTDATPEQVQYKYDVRGVEYFASQDLSAVQQWVPGPPDSLIGPVGVKFDPHNPANSIVLCEEWSGWKKPNKTQGGQQWKSVSV